MTYKNKSVTNMESKPKVPKKDYRVSNYEKKIFKQSQERDRGSDKIYGKKNEFLSPSECTF